MNYSNEHLRQYVQYDEARGICSSEDENKY